MNKWYAFFFESNSCESDRLLHLNTPYQTRNNRMIFLGWLATLSCLLSACGGGSATNSSVVEPSSKVFISSSLPSSKHQESSSFTSSSRASLVTLSGVITYDYVPHFTNRGGLNYIATEKRAVRGALVELLDENDAVLNSDALKNDGSYQFFVAENVLVRIRVKAELSQQKNPSWDYKVTDNTNNNALYVLDGSLTSSGNSNSIRNLHAPSGWDGEKYLSVRAAAPFAILDNVYLALNRLNEAGNNRNLEPMELRWSSKNNAASGEFDKGEIGTSFFDGSAIYILGDADNDTDEYDSHVLLHEFGHYLEKNISRSDNIGGAHSGGEKLDMRVAMSEGFANAFSAMMLNDPDYKDASGSAQSSGFFLSINKANHISKGFFSESSVGSIFYNFYISSNNKKTNDFTSVFTILSEPSYYNNDAMTSIYLFYSRLKNLLTPQAAEFNRLMLEQTIFGTDEYAENELNDGGLALTLPLYKNIKPNAAVVNVCSSSKFGKYNKLSNSQFLKLSISQAGSYSLNAERFGGDNVKSHPESIIYRRGKIINHEENIADDKVSSFVDLSVGTYIIEVYDNSNHDLNNTELNTLCFNVKVTEN